tara:strand:+ start:46602 stop:46802 length:201 start_codon:yes stop_codon:yes gene_type:complete
VLKIIYITVLILFISACDDSDTANKVAKDHVWKEQTDMIDKAKEVDLLMNEAAIQQKHIIEQQLNQ